MRDIVGSAKSAMYLRGLQDNIKKSIKIPASLKTNMYFSGTDKLDWFQLTYCSNRSSTEAELCSQVWLTFYFNLSFAIKDEAEDMITYSVDAHNCPKDIAGSTIVVHYTDVTDLINYWLKEYEAYFVSSIEIAKVTSHNGIQLKVLQTGQFLFLNDIIYEKVDLSLVCKRESRGHYGVYFYDELNKSVVQSVIFRFTNRKEAQKMFKLLNRFSSVYYTKEL